jgi:hypothetical protein
VRDCWWYLSWSIFRIFSGERVPHYNNIFCSCNLSQRKSEILFFTSGLNFLSYTSVTRACLAYITLHSHGRKWGMLKPMLRNRVESEKVRWKDFCNATMQKWFMVVCRVECKSVGHDKTFKISFLPSHSDDLFWHWTMETVTATTKWQVFSVLLRISCGYCWNL